MAAAHNPMASTWRTNLDRKDWTWQHRALERIDIWHNDNGDFPVFPKTDKIRWFSRVSVLRWIVMHLAWPLALHAAWNHFLGPKYGRLPPTLAFPLYAIASLINLRLEVLSLLRTARVIGFLDGDKYSRDKVPDVGINKVYVSIFAITWVRSGILTGLTYRKNDPMMISPWIIAEITLYPIIIDFFFYIYHRATHEVDGLWKYHRTHHLTKHPNPLLSSYADAEQEVIEMAIVPILSYFTMKAFGFPMGFYDFWICQSFVLFTEAFGHSGIRAMMTLPGPAGHLLKAIDCELILEDHDLHHRQGWRKSGNYGKATRLWDRMFGTCLDRLESRWDNVDFKDPLRMSWF